MIGRAAVAGEAVAGADALRAAAHGIAAPGAVGPMAVPAADGAARPRAEGRSIEARRP